MAAWWETTFAQPQTEKPWWETSFGLPDEVFDADRNVSPMTVDLGPETPRPAPQAVPAHRNEPMYPNGALDDLPAVPEGPAIATRAPEEYRPEYFDEYMPRPRSTMELLAQRVPEPVEPETPENLAALSYFNYAKDNGLNPQGLMDWAAGGVSHTAGTARGFGAGAYKAAGDAINALADWNELATAGFGGTGAGPVDDALKAAARWMDTQGENAAILSRYNQLVAGESRPEHVIGQMLTDGVRAIPDMAMVIATTALTRNPNAGYAVMGAQVAAQSYGQARYMEGKGIASALADAFASTAAELGPERAFRVLEPIADATMPLMKRLWKTGLAESASEGATGLLTRLDEEFRQGRATPDSSMDVLTGVLQEAGTGAVAGIGMAGGGAIIHSGTGLMDSRARSQEFDKLLRGAALARATDAFDPNQSFSMRYMEQPSGGILPGFDAAFNQAAADIDDAETLFEQEEAQQWGPGTFDLGIAPSLFENQPPNVPHETPVADPFARPAPMAEANPFDDPVGAVPGMAPIQTPKTNQPEIDTDRMTDEEFDQWYTNTEREAMQSIMDARKTSSQGRAWRTEYNPAKDGFLEMLAKRGGLDADAFEREGFDVKGLKERKDGFNNNRIPGSPIIRGKGKGGLKPDDVAEIISELVQDGTMVVPQDILDEHGRTTVNDVLEVLTQEINGTPVIVSQLKADLDQQAERVRRQLEEARYRRENFAEIQEIESQDTSLLADMESIPTHEKEFYNPEWDSKTRTLADWMDDAIDEGVSDQEIESVLTDDMPVPERVLAINQLIEAKRDERFNERLEAAFKSRNPGPLPTETQGRPQAETPRPQELEQGSAQAQVTGSDLLGQDTSKQQALGDRARAKEEQRSGKPGTETVPVEAGAGELFAGQQPAGLFEQQVKKDRVIRIETTEGPDEMSESEARRRLAENLTDDAIHELDAHERALAEAERDAIKAELEKVDNATVQSAAPAPSETQTQIPPKQQWSAAIAKAEAEWTRFDLGQRDYFRSRAGFKGKENAWINKTEWANLTLSIQREFGKRYLPDTPASAPTADSAPLQDLPAHIERQIQEAGGDPKTIPRINSDEQRREYSQKYGIPNALANENGFPFGKSATLYIDDDTGKPVAVDIRQIQKTTEPEKAAEPAAAPATDKISDFGSVIQGADVLYSGYERDTGNLPIEQKRAAYESAAQLAFDLEPPADVPVARDQLADNFNTHYRHVAVAEFRIGVERVTNAEEAAHVFSVIRKNASEVFYALVLGQGGKILDLQLHSIGTRDAANVYPSTVIPSVVAVPGAKQVYFAHNHPSGLPEPSQADHAITEVLNNALNGTGVTLGGHITLGYGSNAVWFDNNMNTRPVKIIPRLRKLSVKVTERKARKIPPKDRPTLERPDVAYSAVNALEADNAVLLLDTRHRAIGSLALTEKEMVTLKDSGSVRRILTAIDSTNAAAAIIKATTEEAATNVARFLTQSGSVRALDAFVGDDKIGRASRGGMQDLKSGIWFERGIDLSDRGPGALSPSEKMVVQHNLSAAKLRHADKMGGMPMPSIGISRAAHPLEGYGDITLLAKPGLVSPSAKNPVYSADAYTSTYPTITYFLSEADRSKLLKFISEPFGVDRPWKVPSSTEGYNQGRYIGDITDDGTFERRGIEGLESSDELRARYLWEKDAMPSIKEYPDRWAWQNALRDAVKDDPKYAAWAETLAERLDIRQEEKLFNGTTNMGRPRYVPNTLENVVKRMKKDMRENQTGMFGAGALRAQVAPKFRTMGALQKARDRLVSAEEMEKTKSEFNDRLVDISSKFTEYAKYVDSNPFIAGDRVRDQLTEISAGLSRWDEYFNDVPQDLKDEWNAYIKDLVNAPTAYFEAKPHRVVQLQEFEKALVPENAPDDVVAILKRHGLTVERYTDAADKARRIMADESILFTRSQNAQPTRRAEKGRQTFLTRQLERAMARFTGNPVEAGTYTQVESPKRHAASVKAVERVFGRRVVFFRANKPTGFSFNGVVLPGDTKSIYVNIDSQNPFMGVVGHELLHTLRREHPDLYDRLARMARSRLKTTGFADFAEMLDSKIRENKGDKRLSDDAMFEEMVANIVGDAFLDPAFVAELRQMDQNFLQRLVDAIVEILRSFQKRLTTRGMGSSQYFNDVENLIGQVQSVLLKQAQSRSKPAKESAGAPEMAPAFARSPETQSAYEQRIDDLFAGASPNHTGGVRVLDQSDVLDLLGMGNYEVVLAEKHAVSDGKFNHPQFTADDWKKVPKWLDDPVAVLEREDGGLTVIAPETWNGYPIIIGIKPDVTGPPGRSGSKRYHLLLSAYNKDSGRMPLETMVEEGRLRYLNMKKAPEFNRGSGHRLPSNVDRLRGSAHKIYTERDLVKYQRESHPDADDQAPKFHRSQGAPGWVPRVKPLTEVLKSRWNYWMRAQGNLPDVVFAEKIKRDNSMGADELHIRHKMADFDRAVRLSYGKSYNKLTVAEKETLNDYLAGLSVTIPVGVKNAMIPMRDYLDRLSDEMITEGVVQNQDTINKILNNIGQYLNRSYRAFDDPEWPRKVPDSVRRAAYQHIEGRMRQAGKLTGLTAAQIEDKVSGQIENILQEGTAADSIGALVSESKLGSKDLSMLIQRKEIPKPIRDLLGEYRDARVNFVRSATKMERAIMNHVFLEGVKANGQGVFLFNEPTGEYSVRIASEASSPMAPLNGLYTTPEIRDAFTDALDKEQMANWWRWVIGINGFVKYGKTVLSVTTISRNFLSASFFGVANGHFALFNPKATKIAFQTIQRELRSVDGSRVYAKKMKHLGVIYDNPYAGEMIGVLKDFTDSETAYIEGAFKGGARKFFDIMTRIYQAGDDFWKILGFEIEAANLVKHGGMTRPEAEREAAERIRNTYPTYSMVGKAIRWLRRFPLIGTFVSFPAEIVRTSVNIVRYAAKDAKTPGMKGVAAQKIVGIAMAAGLAAAARSISMAIMGFDDDDDEAVRMMGPPWSKNSDLFYVGYDENGLPEYFDLSFLDPYNYLKRPLHALLRGKDDWQDKLESALTDMTTPFIGPDILAGAIGEIVYNQKETGGPVYNPDESNFEQTKAIFNHLRKAVQPGTFGNIERITDAVQGDVSRYGKQYKLADEVWALGGFRKSTLNPLQSISFKAFEFAERSRNATQILSYPLGGQNKVSESEIKSAFERMIEVREEAYQDMIDYVSVAESMNLPGHSIRSVLKASGVSQANINSIMRGRVPPWTPSDQFLDSAKDRAMETAESMARKLELRKTFDERVRLVQKLAREETRRARTSRSTPE